MQTSFYFRETALIHLLLTAGNFFAYILRGANYQANSLYLLEPAKVRVVMVDWQLWYFVEGVKETMPARDMIHVPGLGFDGIQGKTPLRIAREAIGKGLRLQDFASYFFDKMKKFRTPCNPLLFSTYVIENKNPPDNQEDL